MLQTAARYCLQTPKDERHPHQKAAISMLAEVLSHEKISRVRVVEHLSKEIAEADVHIISATDAVEKAATEVVAKKDVYKMRSDELDRLQKRLVEVEQALASEIQHRDRLPQEHEADKAKRAELEQIFEDVWQPLERGRPSWGKEWRVREKLIRILKKNVFDGSLFKVEESLFLGLPPALKRCHAERSQWAHVVVGHAEALFVECLETIDQNIFNVNEEAIRRSALVDNANQRLAAAREQCAVGMEDVTSAETEIRKADAARENANEELDELKFKLEERKKLQEQAQARLNEFLDRCLQFEMVKDFTSCPETAAAVSDSISDNPAEVRDALEYRPQMSAPSSSSAGMPQPLTPQKQCPSFMSTEVPQSLTPEKLTKPLHQHRLAIDEHA